MFLIYFISVRCVNFLLHLNMESSDHMLLFMFLTYFDIVENVN